MKVTWLLQVFWAVFHSSQRPSQISPTADFYGAAIPPPIFFMPSCMKTKICTPPRIISTHCVTTKKSSLSFSIEQLSSELLWVMPTINQGLTNGLAFSSKKSMKLCSYSALYTYTRVLPLPRFPQTQFFTFTSIRSDRSYIC